MRLRRTWFQCSSGALGPCLPTLLFLGITFEVKKQALLACFFDAKEFLKDIYQIVELPQSFHIWLESSKMLAKLIFLRIIILSKNNIEISKVRSYELAFLFG
jgi:hypothetical protein